MEDVGKQPRLLKRGSTYYLRAKVPDELRPIIGKREIKESLKTGVYREAVELLRAASARVDAQFAAATKKLQSGAAKRRDVSKHELQQIAMLWLHSAEASDLADEATQGLPSIEEREQAAYDLANELGALKALTTMDDPDGRIMVGKVVEQLMQENSLELQPTDATYKLLFGFVRRAMTEKVLRRKHRLEVGDDHKAFDALFAAVYGNGPNPSVTEKQTTVDQLLDRYRNDPSRAGSAAVTWSKYETVFRLLREEVGATKPIADITRGDFARMRDILNSLPANATKRFPGMRFADLAEKARAEGLKPMATTTANSHLYSISSIFNYAVKEELVHKNRAHGMRVARAHERRPEERRLPFDLNQLQRIFSAPLYSRPDGARTIALPKSGRFWVPLLSLWSGLRLNECCQLAVVDVQNKDGADFILVRETNDGEQRLKTRAATRTVPIHPELKRIGFLDFVDAQRKAKHKQLFPDLPKSVRGNYSDLFSKYFGRFLRRAAIKTERTSFHSFRHNFRDALREAHVHPSVAKVLGGWEDTGTDATYGVGYKPATLAAELEKISYPGLDLSHLYR